MSDRRARCCPGGRRRAVRAEPRPPIESLYHLGDHSNSPDGSSYLKTSTPRNISITIACGTSHQSHRSGSGLGETSDDKFCNLRRQIRGLISGGGKEVAFWLCTQCSQNSFTSLWCKILKENKSSLSWSEISLSDNGSSGAIDFMTSRRAISPANR